MAPSSSRHSPLSRRSPQAQSQAPSSSSSRLVALGVLVTVFSLFMLYTHTQHMAESLTLRQHQQQARLRRETTYHSSQTQQQRKRYKRIHRTQDGREVVLSMEEAGNEKTQHSRNHQVSERLESNPTNDVDVNTIPNNWPSPRLTTESTVVLVLSARSHVELRHVIRETWGNGHSNVYFVIGQYCSINQPHRKHELTCEAHPDSGNSSTTRHDEWYEKRMKLETQVLIQEQEHYRDMLWTPSPESYRGLPHKLKEAYQWVVKTLPHVHWIVKSDDDTIVRVSSLSHYLETTLSYKKPTVVGKLEYEGWVHTEGRWKEDKYPHENYPTFPLGSCGHAVSRSVAEYVAQHKDSLVEYQGEDTSLGIWMHESPLHVEWLYSTSFENDGQCDNPNSLVIGHDLAIDKIRECYAIGDEVQPI